MLWAAGLMKLIRALAALLGSGSCSCTKNRVMPRRIPNGEEDFSTLAIHDGETLQAKGLRVCRKYESVCLVLVQAVAATFTCFANRAIRQENCWSGQVCWKIALFFAPWIGTTYADVAWPQRTRPFGADIPAFGNLGRSGGHVGSHQPRRQETHLQGTADEYPSCSQGLCMQVLEVLSIAREWFVGGN